MRDPGNKVGLFHGLGAGRKTCSEPEPGRETTSLMLKLVKKSLKQSYAGRGSIQFRGHSGVSF